MRIAILVAYFGKLPSYFQTFLDSCRWNSKFDWIIFADDQTAYYYPENVHRIPMSWEECKNQVQATFDFSVVLAAPQKLCDYKCAYGIIFHKYLQGYDWWGHCDLDQVFGDLSAFITEDMLTRYDKIGSVGHLTLYRNTSECSRVFMSTSRYREVFTTDRGCGFDEWLPGNVNEIWQQSGRPVLLENLGADVNSYKTTFTLVSYDLRQRRYIHAPEENSVFLWEQGKLYQQYEAEEAVARREYPYVHLQKRKMTDARKKGSGDRYYIVPNRFVDGDCSPEVLLRDSRKWKYLNYQYFRVKWKSLQYRLKKGDWKFRNVFR